MTDQTEVNNIYNDLDKILFYARIRNLEENSVLGLAELDRMIQNATFLYNKFDITEALSYINDTFRNSYVVKPGGVNDYLNRKKRAEQNSEE